MSDIYQRLIDKRHYFRNMTLLRKALLPYSDILQEHVPNNNDLTQHVLNSTPILIHQKK